MQQRQYKRAATWARVSKEEQAKDSHALDRQRYFLEQTLQQFGLVESAQRFEEVVSGWRDVSREQFEELQKAIAAKVFDLLIVYRVDRLTRQAGANIEIARLLADANTHVFEIVGEKIYNLQVAKDWEDFVSKGVRGEAEVRELSDRTRRGLTFARHLGHYVGRVPVMYIRRDGLLEPKPGEWEKWREAIALIIAEDSGSWRVASRTVFRAGIDIEPSSLQRTLLNPVMRGFVKGTDGWVKRHPALLTEEEYQFLKAWSDRPKPRYNNKFKQRVTHLFTGAKDGAYFCTCGYCGGRMAAKVCDSKGREYIYYRCADRTEKRPDSPCLNRKGYRLSAVLEDRIEDEVIRVLCQRADAIANRTLTEMVEEEDPEDEALKRQIAQIQRMVEEMGDRYGLMAQQIEMLERERAARKRANPEVDESKREMLAAAAGDPNIWRKFTRSERAKYYKWLVKKITVWSDRVEVELQKF